jgi:hypothetical protein
VPPNLHGVTVTVTVRLDGTHLDIATAPATSSTSRFCALPTVIARHLLASTGAGVMVRDHGHVTALEQAAMNAATTAAPHRGKQRLPPTPAALAQAAALRARTGDTDIRATDDVVVNLARYAAAAAGRNTLRAIEGETHTAPKESPNPSTTNRKNRKP